MKYAIGVDLGGSHTMAAVVDSKGKILLSRLNPAGSEAEVSGKPPFNVIVGNAPEVQVFYNDHEFDLEPHTKVAVARFIVE